jgi:hypothetical protein
VILARHYPFPTRSVERKPESSLAGFAESRCPSVLVRSWIQLRPDLRSSHSGHPDLSVKLDLAELRKTIAGMLAESIMSSSSVGLR